jgi:hypothetical protein
MAENVREVEGLFVNIVNERRNLEHADDLAQMLLEQKKVENETLELVFHGAELKDASRTTAEVTGAFGHMEYAEVERFAAVYGLQTAFNRAQERTRALSDACRCLAADESGKSRSGRGQGVEVPDCPYPRRAHRRGADRSGAR